MKFKDTANCKKRSNYLWCPLLFDFHRYGSGKPGGVFVWGGIYEESYVFGQRILVKGWFWVVIKGGGRNVSNLGVDGGATVIIQGTDLKKIDADR